MCINLVPHALCIQNLKLRPFVDTEKLHLQKSPSEAIGSTCCARALTMLEYSCCMTCIILQHVTEIIFTLSLPLQKNVMLCYWHEVPYTDLLTVTNTAKNISNYYVPIEA